MGTLGYMPLQQLRGRPVDARADQFSFCASLYEALYGELPYEGETAEQLVAAYEHDEPKPPPKDSTVPSRLRQILLRGLALEPESRWPSMPILLGELDALVEPKARRWLALGLAVGMVGIGTGAVLGADEESPC
ncbi:MAG: protein kinase, partial [Myxococcales bacterium]|nr:protein kinase [Myxococcales bacterium]